MYNKLFTKILDSSIWLESEGTRLVWLTLLAAMDEDGFARFAAVGNLAHRARVSPKDTEKAVQVLEAPDSESSDPDNEGRRIERVPGGWVILNHGKHKDIVTRLVQREQTRLRVKKHREKRNGNASVTVSSESVTPSETVSTTSTEPEKKKNKAPHGTSSVRVQGVAEVIRHLNKITGSAYKEGTQRPVLHARLAEGATVEDCKLVLDWCQSREFWRDNGHTNDATPFRKRSWEGKVQGARSWDKRGRPPEKGSAPAEDPTGGKYDGIDWTKKPSIGAADD